MVPCGICCYGIFRQIFDKLFFIKPSSKIYDLLSKNPTPKFQPFIWICSNLDKGKERHVLSRFEQIQIRSWNLGNGLLRQNIFIDKIYIDSACSVWNSSTRILCSFVYILLISVCKFECIGELVSVYKYFHKNEIILPTHLNLHTDISKIQINLYT